MLLMRKSLKFKIGAQGILVKREHRNLSHGRGSRDFRCPPSCSTYGDKHVKRPSLSAEVSECKMLTSLVVVEPLGMTQGTQSLRSALASLSQ